MALALRHHSNPFADFLGIQEDVNRFLGPGSLRIVNQGQQASRDLTPAVDVEANENQYQIIVDLPGIPKKDVQVEVDGNKLSISASRNQENDTSENGYVRRERSFGTYTRSFTLPDTADLEALSAKQKDGVLTVTIPKLPEVQPKQIKVQ